MERIIGIAAFTKCGKALAQRLSEQFMCSYRVMFYESNLKEWCKDRFQDAESLIFIGACGIAVRTIAPFLKSKLTDPGVLVIDEKGQFVISLLSGHIGGANEFALQVAEMINAVPVLTTASDVNGKLAIDVFAKKNNLHICSMEAAKKIAAAILREETVGIYCTGRIMDVLPPELSHASTEQKTDHIVWISERKPDREVISDYLTGKGGTVLHLVPKNLILGAGCRRGKTLEEIRKVTGSVLAASGAVPEAVCAVASIDLKKEEPGLQALAEALGVSFFTYPAEALAEVPGEFQVSDFVKGITGVDNVCERAALLCGKRSAKLEDYPKLICRKHAENGVTAALAALEWRIYFEK